MRYFNSIFLSFFPLTQPTNLITGATAHQQLNSIKGNYSGTPRMTRSTAEWISWETQNNPNDSQFNQLCCRCVWMEAWEDYGRRRHSSTVVHINVLSFEIQFGWDWIYDSVWCQWINGNERLAVVYTKPFTGQQQWLWLGERGVCFLVCTFGEIAFVQLRLIKRTIHHTSP